MTPAEIMSRFQPFMPDGVRFAAAIPLPYKDEEGNWQPLADAVIVRVSNNVCYVDGLCTEADLAWTDEMFHERIIRPMITCLEQSA